MLSRLIASTARLGFIVAALLAGCGLLIFILRFPAFALLAAVGTAWWQRRRWRGSNWSHGSATVASLATLERANLLDDGQALIVGRPQPERPLMRTAIGGLLSPRIKSDVACRRFLASMLGPQWYEDRMVKVPDFCHLLTCARRVQAKEPMY